MNSRTTAIGVFNHPLIRAIIENDIAKASEVNRLIVEEVMAEASNPSLVSAVARPVADLSKAIKAAVKGDKGLLDKWMDKFSDENKWYTPLDKLPQQDQETYSDLIKNTLASLNQATSNDQLESILKDANEIRTNIYNQSNQQQPATQEQDPLQALKGLLGSLNTMEDYNSARQQLGNALVRVVDRTDKRTARQLITQRAKELHALDAQKGWSKWANIQLKDYAHASEIGYRPEVYKYIQENVAELGDNWKQDIDDEKVTIISDYLEMHKSEHEQEEEPEKKTTEPAATADPSSEEGGKEPSQSTTAPPEEVATAVDSAVDAVEDGQDTKTAATQAAAKIKPTADSEEQEELTNKIETVIGQKVAAAKTSADTEAVANEEQLEPLLAAYSNFENEFMDVRTLREQGNILVALMKALTEFEKTAERSAVRESAKSGMEKIDAETKVDLRKSVEGIKRNMSSVLSALKQYKSKMFDINSNDIKKVVVSALNNIQDELKRAYDALECEVRPDCNKRAHKLEEQVTDESISQVRKAYNTILSAISEFYNEAQKGRYKVSFRDSTFAKAREAIEGIQDYFPQISPFSTGQSIDQITPQLSKVFMKLRPVMDEFLALSKGTTTRRDTINKFMERTKEVSLEINNLFGAETEIPAVEKEIEAVPAATADTSGEDTNAEQPEAPAASAVVPSAEVVWDDENDLDDFEGTGEEEEEEEGETPDQEKEPEVEPEEEEEEEEAAPVPVPAAASEETPDEEPEDYNSNWIGNLNIEQEYIDQLTGDGLRNEINNLISDTLAEATPKLRTLGAKAKGMVPSKFSFLAKTLDKFEIGNQSAKTLLKALKDENPKYVIALNLIPKDKLEGYLKNWVGLKLKIQHREDLETLDDWKEYGEYLKNNAPKNPHGNRQISDKDMRRFFDFLQANANNLQYGDWDILEVKYDSDEEEINLDLMFNEETDTESLDAANIFPLFRDLKTKDDSLQEQITKLLTPMIREQIRGKNG